MPCKNNSYTIGSFDLNEPKQSYKIKNIDGRGDTISAQTKEYNYKKATIREDRLTTE